MQKSAMKEAAHHSRQTAGKMLRTGDAAAYCGCAESTFHKMRGTGSGPEYFKIGKTVVYDPDDLDAWLASHRRKSTSVAA